MAAAGADKVLDLAANAIGSYLRAQKPYLFLLDQKVVNVKDGVVSVELRIFEGFVTDVVVHTESKRYKFKKSFPLPAKPGPAGF